MATKVESEKDALLELVKLELNKVEVVLVEVEVDVVLVDELLLERHSLDLLSMHFSSNAHCAPNEKQFLKQSQP